MNDLEEKNEEIERVDDVVSGIKNEDNQKNQSQLAAQQQAMMPQLE